MMVVVMVVVMVMMVLVVVTVVALEYRCAVGISPARSRPSRSDMWACWCGDTGKRGG